MEPWIWAIIFAVCILIEFATLELFAIFVAGGALGGMVMAFMPITDPGWAVASEVIVCIGVTFILLLLLRPIIKKMLMGKTGKFNMDGIEGRELTLQSDIKFGQHGKIKVNGVVWNAISENEKDEILRGATVRLIKLDGNKWVVKEVVEVAEVAAEEKPEKGAKPKTAK
ncbi:MAG: hypothetical protein FWD89_01955 [Firmicutes bacterium]|nr:hypothetical protein [Bacillota bacterium]